MCNQFAEILVSVFISGDVLHSGITDNGCRVNAVSVAWTRRHQTVCCEKHRGRDILEFRLLTLPAGSEIPGKMLIFRKLRIAMCRKHLAVCVDTVSYTHLDRGAGYGG